MKLFRITASRPTSWPPSSQLPFVSDSLRRVYDRHLAPGLTDLVTGLTSVYLVSYRHEVADFVYEMKMLFEE
ncbi:unnamed protein product [Protopolystoma xenopodis]|uniref:Uncharacterized protein n=1 Tax=Protopolystoma xenopodis TaxID=117903 RepID=A0A448WEK5_9PLAT|nr:unnamed protein product [Protopolystoma xenopodis]